MGKSYTRGKMLRGYGKLWNRRFFENGTFDKNGIDIDIDMDIILFVQYTKLVSKLFTLSLCNTCNTGTFVIL